MKLRTVILREIADSALAGRRHWSSLSELAQATGASLGLTHRVVAELGQIGVTRPCAGGGFDVTSPEKAVALFAASRNVMRETRLRISLSSAERVAAQPGVSAIGGMDAAVHHLGGINVVASIGLPRILYVVEPALVTIQSDGDDVAVLGLDPIGSRSWTDTGFASWAQTYGDLFGLPGWQAEEFRRAMYKSAFSVDDWETLSA